MLSFYAGVMNYSCDTIKFLYQVLLKKLQSIDCLPENAIWPLYIIIWSLYILHKDSCQHHSICWYQALLLCPQPYFRFGSNLYLQVNCPAMDVDTHITSSQYENIHSYLRVVLPQSCPLILLLYLSMTFSSPLGRKLSRDSTRLSTTFSIIQQFHDGLSLLNYFLALQVSKKVSGESEMFSH